MLQRISLLFAAGAAMVTVAAMSLQQQSGLLLLDWAAKAPAEKPVVAILIEMGLKDVKPASWSNVAKVTGAKVVRREGYRFQEGDKLTEPDGWEASSHRHSGKKATAATAALYKVATIGVVLHLSDVQPNATLTMNAKGAGGEKVVVALKDVLAGQTKLLWNGAAAVRRFTTTTPLVTAKTEDDFPAAAYGPDGTLWMAYISYTDRDNNREHAIMRQIKKAPTNFKGYYTPEFGDQLFVKHYQGGKWSEPIAITGPREDLVRCAIAVAGDGTAWVAYSAQRTGNYDVYARPIGAKHNLGKEERLTTQPGPDLGPVMCTDQQGRVWLTCQSWDETGTAHIALFNCRDNLWKNGPALPKRPTGENQWHPSLAAGPDGRVAVVYDVYKGSDYDIVAAIIEGERVTERALAASPKFEARPSAIYDAAGRLWVAYEEGPAKWGKDFGALVPDAGMPLYAGHAVRVVCLAGDKLLKPTAALPDFSINVAKLIGDGANFVKYEFLPRHSYPQIGLDGKGRVWLSYRQKIGTPFGTFPGSNWLTYARRLDGDQWTDPIEVHHSDGLLDHRPVLLPHAGGSLLVIHNTDGRFDTPENIDNQIYASIVDLPGEPLEAKLVPADPGRKNGNEADQERADVQRIREYRVESAGAKYQLLRGEFHRHTEISFDGGSDGSLEDMFRYAIDAAAMDWIGNGDHDSGASRDYTWWLIQKFTDAYHVKNRFLPMFTYERSVSYPHGHRNCVFAKRGVRTLSRLAQPDEAKQVAGVHADDTKMLYRYLKELDGICASHTSATNMGTDWRDHDPKLEPIVEIYQGDRNSYEMQGAPRAGFDPKSKKAPANIGGWYPAGYIDLALRKMDVRLGFQASSDHWSTHISFCIALAEKPDRESILAALKKRHCYGATDNIIVDVRSGDHIMGDEFKTNAAPALALHVIGTNDLAKIEILKDSAVVETIKSGKRDYKGTWTDPNPTPGVHYYYVRVQQVDGQLAWASPMWIDFTR